jgi:hypothetical protein
VKRAGSFFAVTPAAETTAPDWSVTVPESSADTWAEADVRMQGRNRRKRARVLMSFKYYNVF